MTQPPPPPDDVQPPDLSSEPPTVPPGGGSGDEPPTLPPNGEPPDESEGMPPWQRNVLIGLGAVAVVTFAIVGIVALTGDDEPTPTTIVTAGTTTPSTTIDPTSSSSSPTTTPTTSTSTTSTTTTTTPTTSSSTTSSSTTTTSTSTTTTSTTTSTTSTTVATTIPGSGVVLEGNGLDVAEFGDDPEEAIAALTDALGDPDEDTGWVGSTDSQFGTCPGTVVRGVRWQTLWALFTDGETEWEEDDPHFFAYQHASFFDPSAVMGLVTEEGVGLGSSRAELEDAYGDRVIVGFDQAADAWTFQIDEPPEAIGGSLTGEAATDVVESMRSAVNCTE